MKFLSPPSAMYLRACRRWLHGKSCTVEDRFIPRRALMYVPGSDERKLAKIPSLKADCICLDCEDGVSFVAKDEARSNIRQLLATKSQDFFGPSECSVRINSIQSGLCHLDVEEIMAPPETKEFLIPSAIHLPKVESPENLDEFVYMFNSATSNWIRPGSKTRIGLILFIESAQGLIDIRRICETAAKIREKSALMTEALVFGSDDFVADIGAVRTSNAIELLYARQKIVAHAKAFGWQAIDLVHIDFKDLEGLREHSINGAYMGFTGKQVIHPSQIPVVHEAFAPSDKRVEWASQLIQEFREHERSGKGAFVFRGNMIDMPLVKQAENMLITHQAISKRE